MADDDAYDLAYRAAVRALDHQLAAVTELRNRASLLLAAASIALSLLGPRALEAPPLGWLAVACFLLLNVCVLVIVWPRATWKFDTDPDALLAHLAAGDSTIATMTTDLIAYMTNDRRANARTLTTIATAFRTGTCLLAIQMLSTVIAVTIGS